MAETPEERTTVVVQRYPDALASAGARLAARRPRGLEQAARRRPRHDAVVAENADALAGRPRPGGAARAGSSGQDVGRQAEGMTRAVAGAGSSAAPRRSDAMKEGPSLT